MADGTRTITLTNRRPVVILEEQWPVVAVARWHDGDQGIEARANRRAQITVRQHRDDGRMLVYGVVSSNFPREWGGARAGFLLEERGSRDDERLVGAIREVALRIGHDKLADECIADLPAQVLE